MNPIKKFFIGVLKLLLLLIGAPAVLFSLRLIWGGVDLFRESGDRTAAAFFLVMGAALFASGLFILRRALKL